MNENNNFTLNDIEEMMKKSNQYSPDNMADHLVELELRKQKLNQTCTSVSDKIKFERVEAMYNSAKSTYTNVTGEYTLEKKLEMMIKLGQLSRDMRQLENNQKGVVKYDE